ncbi:MAG: YraN family protein [Bacteroidetes bacterium]|nr:MAG: YraN family protein [Bacteroidota bacterium]
MAEHNILGKKGEGIATDFLIKNGYEIVERNWRTGRDEIDIIARKDNLLVIVEVKTRSTDYFGEPEEAVTTKKQMFLVRAADKYVNKYEIDDHIRYDIISIILKSGSHTINHIEDAFYPILFE